jgi:hypothetical protein
MSYLRRISTYLLLSVYGATALLGYGLHLLAPDCHHHGLSQVSWVGPAQPDEAGHDFVGLYCPQAVSGVAPGTTESPVLTAGEAYHSESCSICDFLAQARSVPPQVTTAVVWQRATAAVEPFAPRFSAQTEIGSQAPRGPPLFAA